MTSIADLDGASKKDVKAALSKIQIIPKIDAFLEDLNLEPHEKRLGVFSASDIGSDTGHSLCGQYKMGCACLLYYRYIEEEPRTHIDPRTRRIFDTGHKVHDQLQGYLKRIAEWSEGAEVFVKEAMFNEDNSAVAKKYEIESTTDGIWEIKIPDLNIRFGIEIKSMKTELFKTLNAPKPETVVQAMIYMACLDLPLVTIIYYNKNDSVMMEFPMTFDQKVWDAVVDKINYVREAAVDEKPPKQEVGFHCKRCRYYHVCKPPKPQRKSVSFGRRKFRLSGE